MVFIYYMNRFDLDDKGGRAAVRASIRVDS